MAFSSLTDILSPSGLQALGLGGWSFHKDPFTHSTRFTKTWGTTFTLNDDLFYTSVNPQFMLQHCAERAQKDLYEKLATELGIPKTANHCIGGPRSMALDYASRANSAMTGSLLAPITATEIALSEKAKQQEAKNVSKYARRVIKTPSWEAFYDRIKPILSVGDKITPLKEWGELRPGQAYTVTKLHDNKERLAEGRPQHFSVAEDPSSWYFIRGYFDYAPGWTPLASRPYTKTAASNDFTKEKGMTDMVNNFVKRNENFIGFIILFLIVDYLFLRGALLDKIRVACQGKLNEVRKGDAK